MTDLLKSIKVKETGVLRMVAERIKQAKRYTTKDDVFNNPNGELIVAARALMKENCVLHDFPDSWGVAACRKLSLKPYTERLVIAGTLLAAEVDRRSYIQQVMRHPLTTDEAFKTDPE